MFFLCRHLSVQAQDIHFSQYYASPLTLNPAGTGLYNGDWRVANNYRRQWGAISIPYVTYALSYDRKFYPWKEKVAAGIVLVSDKSGNANIRVNKIYLSGSYTRTISGFGIHIGYQGGYVLKSFSSDGLTFPDQFDMSTGHFNASLPNGETLSDNLSYGDMNAGIAFTKKIKRFEPRAGFALFHFNRPVESFYNDEQYRLKTRKVFHASVRTRLNSLVDVLPNMLIMAQSGAMDLLLGSNVYLRIPPNKYKAQAVFCGFLFRSGFGRNVDAGVAIAGINFKNVEFGLSYDVNISSLRNATNYQGGLEISLIYTHASTWFNKIAIPCERF